ncbi:MAG: helix-turn-helix transcriptional regulator [Candidatus Paceibacterota bacterium]
MKLLVLKADLSLNAVVKIENGVNRNSTIETLTKIAKAFEVGVDDLINKIK